MIQDSLVIWTINHGDIVSIVDFIYHGETEIGKDNLENFLEIAGELGVKGITKQSRSLSDELLSVSDKTEFVPVVTKPVKTALEDSKPMWNKNYDNVNESL